MILKKRVKKDATVVQVDGLTITFRDPDPYERVTATQYVGNMGELCRLSMGLITKIEPAVKFDDGTTVTPGNFGLHADDEMVMKVFAAWMKERAEQNEKAAQAVEAEAKKASEASTADAPSGSDGSSESPSTDASSTGESSRPAESSPTA